MVHTHTHTAYIYSHTTYSHTHTTLSHTHIFHTQLFHADNFVTHISFTEKFVTRNFVTHISLTYNFVTRNFVTHNFLTHISLTHHFVTHTQSFTRNFVIHNFVTHTHISLTYNFVTHNFVTHTQLCHTQLCHTHLSHIQLCHTQSFTQNSLTHNSFTHDSPTYNFLILPILHHLLCISCLVRTASSTASDHWKKLTCGVIRSFNFLGICIPSKKDRTLAAYASCPANIAQTFAKDGVPNYSEPERLVRVKTRQPIKAAENSSTLLFTMFRNCTTKQKPKKNKHNLFLHPKVQNAA